MRRRHPRAIEIEAYAWLTLADPIGVQPPGGARRLVRRLCIPVLKLKTAIQLDLFTVIADGGRTVPRLAHRLRVPVRGVRMLCDFLVVMGFLDKSMEDNSDARYDLTPDSAMFLSKKSPAYIGSATDFMGSAFVMDAFRDLTAIVRAGGPPPHKSRIDTEDPAWVAFARDMAPMMYPAAGSTRCRQRLKRPLLQ